ncbi:MAG: long-chain fatty acid--CoA ligase [Bacteroidota bacterium]|nr:long-chain fatty acid--CoA ligase [Bacteroidota bacterium]
MGVAVQFSTINEMFDRVTKKFELVARPVLRYKVEKEYRDISYKQLRRHVELFTLGLSSLGVKRHDKIAIISENRPEWVIADMAIVTLGAVSVPIYPTLTPKQIEYIFNDAQVSIVVVSNQSQFHKIRKIKNDVRTLHTAIVMSDRDVESDDFVHGFSEVYPLGERIEQQNKNFFSTITQQSKPSDLLTIIYTSGTTGNPKGVMLTHHNLVSNIKASAEVIPIGSSDTLLSFLPLCHSFERMAGYYTAMACGATVAYAESAETVRDNLLEIRPTIMTAVPRLFERIQSRILKSVDGGSATKKKIFDWAIDVGRRYAKAKRRSYVNPLLAAQQTLADKLVFSKLRERTGGRLKFFVSGGAALPRELGEFFEAAGIIIIEGYGLTETSPVLCVNRLDDYEYGTVGKPIEGVSIKIAEDGEILAKGPNIMKGYYNNPKGTKEVIDHDGWFHTGDIGVFDSKGHLMITDRKKHLFVSSGGKNIAPQPIENLFLQSKFIDQFVLIGDRKMFLSALVVPDIDAVQEFAEKNKITYLNPKDLLQKNEIYSMIEQDIHSLQKDLAHFERVRKFVLLDKPFSIEEGEMTPTLKIKRNIVEQRYAHLIDDMYKNIV